MPVRKMMALFIACAVLGILMPLAAIKVFGLRPEREIPVESATAESSPGAEPFASADVGSLPAPKPAEPANAAYPVEGVFATGVLQRGERIIVTFSDGSQATNQHAGLQAVYAGSHVVVDGRRIPIKGRSRSTALDGGPLPAVGGNGAQAVAAQPVTVYPDVIAGAEISAQLPAMTQPDPRIHAFLSAGRSGIGGIEAEAARMLSDPIHR